MFYFGVNRTYKTVPDKKKIKKNRSILASWVKVKCHSLNDLLHFNPKIQPQCPSAQLWEK